MRVLFVAGDPGGSRALIPVINEVARRGGGAQVVRHGFLGNEFSPSTNSIMLDESVASDLIQSTSKRPDCLVFASSATDTYPLSLAAQARDHGIPIIHVCDNWSHYAPRVMLDGCLIIPDCYCVMDDDALRDAIQEGLPESRLFVTGQPALGKAVETFWQHRKKVQERVSRPNKSLELVFFAEPYASVFGSEVSAPGHCGFTEYQVLELLCTALLKVAPEAYVYVVPHPKHDVAHVRNAWNQGWCSLAGEVVVTNDVRELLARVDGAVGMASSLLYEAWMYGVPSLVLQPNCKKAAMKRYARLADIFYLGEPQDIFSVVEAWCGACRAGIRVARDVELLHRSAAGRIADLIFSKGKR